MVNNPYITKKEFKERFTFDFAVDGDELLLLDCKKIGGSKNYNEETMYKTKEIWRIVDETEEFFTETLKMDDPDIESEKLINWILSPKSPVNWKKIMNK